MARKPKKPGYWHHKASNQAYCRISGRDHYLGEFGSDESKARYQELIAEWLTGQSSSQFTIRLDEISLRYIQHCRSYYVKDGQETSEVYKSRDALKIVIKLAGRNRVTQFGPQKLLAVREEMVSRGWSRITINQQIGRIRRCFKWGVMQELVPPEVLTALETVPGLRAGRSAAKESKPVGPVSLAAVNAIKPFVTRPIWAMIQVQLLTGSRPGEICQMRGCDLMMSGEIWEYRPGSHKNQHRGKERLIMIGREAQSVIREFLKSDTTEYLFSPADAIDEFNAKRRANRKSPRTPSQKARKSKLKPERMPGSRYKTSSYNQAIRKACERAFNMPRELRNVSTKLPDAIRDQLKEKARAWREEHAWHPHQLRHTAATTIRKEFGIEAAQSVLGHASLSMTEHYAQKDRTLAEQVMAKLG